jgi:hypothetical protein
VIAGFRDFEFPLADALLRELVRTLDEMETAPLLLQSLAHIPEAQGVYQLFKGNTLVYVGKTDGEAGLQKRLARHATAILQRKNLDPHTISFKAVRVLVFSAMDLETLLIRHYSEQSDIAWNKSGFGSNDPGRNRDHTTVKPEGFDASYPVDIDRVLHVGLSGVVDVAKVLSKMKDALPYVFRFEAAAPKSRKPHPELISTKLALPVGETTTREYLKHVVGALPPGWQATAFPGRVILYRESFDYEYGSVIGRSM